MPHRVIAGASRTGPQALLSAGMVQAPRPHLRPGCLVLFHGGLPRGSAFGPGPDAGRAAERRAVPHPRRFGVFAGAGASPLPGASAQKRPLP